MNRRMQKKAWKQQTTAQQADLLERVDALEKLSKRMAAEQNAQRERIMTVSDDFMIHKNTINARLNREAANRARREQIRLEREMERREIHRSNVRAALMLAGAMGLLVLALMMPAPETTTPGAETEPAAVAAVADPAEGVVEAMAMSWEG